MEAVNLLNHMSGNFESWHAEEVTGYAASLLEQLTWLLKNIPIEEERTQPPVVEAYLETLWTLFTQHMTASQDLVLSSTVGKYYLGSTESSDSLPDRNMKDLLFNIALMIGKFSNFRENIQGKQVTGASHAHLLESLVNHAQMINCDIKSFV